MKRLKYPVKNMTLNVNLKCKKTLGMNCNGIVVRC
jgi:hypothetical protein